jgi:CheY-like chemotaxis protein
MAYYRHAFLLDDDPAALFLLENALQEARIGEQIYCFTRFEHLLPAFERLAEEHGEEEDLPDLLLLDLNMPAYDGLEVLEQLLRIPGIGGNRVCVFILSVTFHPRIEAKIKQYPVSGYLTKPLHEDDLRELIKSARRDGCELKEIG